MKRDAYVVTNKLHPVCGAMKQSFCVMGLACAAGAAWTSAAMSNTSGQWYLSRKRCFVMVNVKEKRRNWERFYAFVVYVYLHLSVHIYMQANLIFK